MGGPLGGPGLEPRFNETLNVGVMHKVNSRDDAKPISTKHRRAIQKSIDLQDYLNFTTGLDYKKLATISIKPNGALATKKGDTARKDSISDAVNPLLDTNKGAPLFDKIAKNKYITEKDMMRDQEEERERKRQEKLRIIDAELTMQAE